MEIKSVKEIINPLADYSRRKKLKIIYEGKDITNDISKTIKSANYSDSINELDSIQLDIDDRDNNWLFYWKPQKADVISLDLELYNWEIEGGVIKNKIGSYYVDTIRYSGPPSSCTLKAVSVNLESKILDSKNSKDWKNIDFKSIARDIAKRAGLELSYTVEITRYYERVEQREQSDFDFIRQLANELEINIKLYNDKLVVFEETLMEKQSPLYTISRGDCINYDFEYSDTENYKECEIRYHDYKTNEVIASTFRLERMKDYKNDNNRKLIIVQNRSPKGKNKDEKQKNLKELARKELKKKNNNALQGTIQILGRKTPFYSGTTLQLTNFGRLNGKYLIRSVEVNLKTYTCSLNIRACNYEEYENA